MDRTNKPDGMSVEGVDGTVQIEACANGRLVRLRVTAAYARRLAADLVVSAAGAEPEPVENFTRRGARCDA